MYEVPRKRPYYLLFNFVYFLATLVAHHLDGPNEQRIRGRHINHSGLVIKYKIEETFHQLELHLDSIDYAYLALY